MHNIQYILMLLYDVLAVDLWDLSDVVILSMYHVIKGLLHQNWYGLARWRRGRLHCIASFLNFQTPTKPLPDIHFSRETT